MRSFPLIMNEGNVGERLFEIDPAETAFDENWLQQLIFEHPEILPVAEIEGIFAPMISIGREVSTKLGSIDNLFMSQRGYPVLVETKLWRNPEARRNVVAQALDYASALSEWDFMRLDESVRKFTKRMSNEQGLIELIEENFGEIEEGHEYFIDTVNKNLRLGRFLILIVGDKIHESTTPIVEFINRYPGLAFDFALIELQCFKLTQDGLWPLLVIPRIMKRTEVIERSVVQVNIEEGKKPQVTVTQEKTSTGPVTRRPTLTEEAFWELIRKQDNRSYESTRKLVTYMSNNPRIELTFGPNALSAKYFSPDFEKMIYLFHINKDGSLNVWGGLFKRQKLNLYFKESMIERYIGKMRSLLHSPKQISDMKCSANEVNIDGFITAVDEFVSEIEDELARKS